VSPKVGDVHPNRGAAAKYYGSRNVIVLTLTQRFPTREKFPQGGFGCFRGGNSGQAGNFQKLNTALIIELGSPKWVFLS